MLYPPSKLDGNLVLRYAFDEATQTLRTTATATIITPPAIEVSIDQTTDSIRLGDGTNFFTSTQVALKNGLDVNLINTSINVDNITGTISLPTGAATSALQLTTNTILTGIDSKLPTTLGQQLSANSLSVVIASDQTLSIELDAFTTPTPDNIMTVGSIDGTKTGTKFGFVNNVRQQILAAHDRESAFSYDDFGTKNERISRIDFTSATFPGFTVRKDFIYTLVSGKYRLDDINYTLV